MCHRIILTAKRDKRCEGTLIIVYKLSVDLVPASLGLFSHLNDKPTYTPFIMKIIWFRNWFIVPYDYCYPTTYCSQEHRKIENKEGPVHKMEGALTSEAKVLHLCFSSAAL